VADPTLGSLTKGASCVSDDWKVCIINFGMKLVDFHVVHFFIFNMFPSCLKDIHLNTTLKCHDFFYGRAE